MSLFKSSKKGNAGELDSFSYSPGYSDMRGASHRDTLEKNDAGEWVIVSRNREYHSAPFIVTTYAVDQEKAAHFERFIKEKNVISLANRLKSKEFICDHSPWNFNIVFDCSAVGGSSYDDYSIGQYKIYTPNDRELLKELKSKFYALKGDMLSETEETD